MKEKIGKHLNFVSGILFASAAVLNFFHHKVGLGFTYLCLAIVQCSLDFSKKKNKKEKQKL